MRGLSQPLLSNKFSAERFAAGSPQRAARGKASSRPAAGCEALAPPPPRLSRSRLSARAHPLPSLRSRTLSAPPARPAARASRPPVSAGELCCCARRSSAGPRRRTRSSRARERKLELPCGVASGEPRRAAAAAPARRVVLSPSVKLGPVASRARARTARARAPRARAAPASQASCRTPTTGGAQGAALPHARLVPFETADALARRLRVRVALGKKEREGLAALLGARGSLDELLATIAGVSAFDAQIGRRGDRARLRPRPRTSRVARRGARAAGRFAHARARREAVARARARGARARARARRPSGSRARAGRRRRRRESARANPRGRRPGAPRDPRSLSADLRAPSSNPGRFHL